jgi:hypothetical protein
MVITTGMINNMRCMVTGWYVEKSVAPDVVVEKAVMETARAAAISSSPPRTLTPTLSLVGEGEGEGEGGNEGERQRSEIAFKADSQANPKDEGGGNEKKAS